MNSPSLSRCASTGVPAAAEASLSVFHARGEMKVIP